MLQLTVNAAMHVRYSVINVALNLTSKNGRFDKANIFYISTMKIFCIIIIPASSSLRICSIICCFDLLFSPA